MSTTRSTGGTNRLAAMEGYLSAHVEDLRSPDDGIEERLRPFITISRQAGAGGHLLAEALLEAFARQDDVELFAGWQVFDCKLCEIAAENPTFSRSMSSLLAEEYRPRTDEFFRQMLGSSIDQDMLMLHVFEVVRAVASIGKAIIVGRAGSEVTRDLAQGFSLRLIASDEIRLKRVMERYGFDERAARNEAKKLDTSRARLLKSHFRADINDPTLYDAVWNTGRMPISAIAASVAATVRHQAALVQSEGP